MTTCSICLKWVPGVGETIEAYDMLCGCNSKPLYDEPKTRYNPSKEASKYIAGKKDLGGTLMQPKQVGGDHYQLAIQPIDYILQNKLGYCEGNVVKYVTRHASKNGAEDIKKAIHYLEFILKDTYDTDPK